MELLLGAHVREYGDRVGRLAGFELELTTLRIRRILVSPDGALSAQTTAHLLHSVAHVHDRGEIELRADVEAPPMPSVSDVVTLGRDTRMTDSGREAGKLVGIEVDAGESKLVSAFVRHGWLARRTEVPAKQIDFSKPGELRRIGTSRAA
jgi:sporulation protein YlmC with PRC-barrel domain